MSANQQVSMGARLADRVRSLGIAARMAEDIVAEPRRVPHDVLHIVRDALLNGETHYTSRPGIVGLRMGIAEGLSNLGAPSFDAATEVIITAGERESLFVTLLGLRAAGRDVWTIGDVARYEALFSLMGLTPKALTDLEGEEGSPRQPQPASPARLVYRDRGATTTDHDRMMRLAIASAVTDVLNVGAAVGDAAVVALPPIGPATVVIGGLDALPGQHAFGAGFVAGPAALLNPIRTWKQAFSILWYGCALAACRLGGDGGVSVSGGPAEGDGMSAPGAQRATTPDLRYTLMELAETLPDVLSLGRGDPDMHTPASIVEAGVRALEFPVAPSPVQGLERLRTALAERYAREKELHFEPAREILITNGAQEGLFLTMLALVNPGDRVLVPDPRYSSVHDQAIEAAGGQLIELPTSATDDFQLQAETLERYAEGAKLLILVNPSNPTGSLVPPDQVEAIAAVARRRDLLMISDEIYENLVFDGGRVQSVAACEGMRERTVTLSGFSKTYAMTGFRVGYLAGPAAFIEAATQIKAAVSGACPLLSQHVALAALEGSQTPVAELHSTFARRRQVMMNGLTALGIPYATPGGGFYVWADISQFGMPAPAFCRRLLIDHRVLIFPGSSFGAKWNGYVRISLLQTEERLTEALDRLAQFISALGTEAIA